MSRKRSRNKKGKKQSARKPYQYKWPWWVVFPLDRFLDLLESEGIVSLGIAQRLKVNNLLYTLGMYYIPDIQQIKYKIAALLCTSGEQQERFYKLFDDYTGPFLPGGRPRRKPRNPRRDHHRDRQRRDRRPPRTPRSRNAPSPGRLSGLLEEPAPLNFNLPIPKDIPAPAPLQTTRKGPISFELNFRNPSEGVWELTELEPVARILREKEITEIEEWNIALSIQKTVRAGGVPKLIRQSRRKSPEYLFLIEQKNSKDHLAALYAELVLELQSLDLDADYFFYDHLPLRCWKERRRPSTYTTLERLHNDYAQSRLIIIGEPDCLLDRPIIRPSALAMKIRQDWRSAALLSTRSTADWDILEAILCRAFPVAPANITGLNSLLKQWDSNISYTPYYWKLTLPEPTTPTLVWDSTERPTDAEFIQALKIHLGQLGFSLLCAVTVYPEIYWQLTKAFKHCLLKIHQDVDFILQKKLWFLALFRISRLSWLRDGEIPTEYRTLLRNQIDRETGLAIREELIRILNKEDNTPPENSYAEADRAFTLALLEYEKNILTQPGKKIRYESLFRKQVESEGISLADISDAVGRQLWERITAPPEGHLPEGEGLTSEQLLQDFISLSESKMNEGSAALISSNFEEARNAYKFALSRMEEIGNLSKMADALKALVGLETKLGDFYTASEHLESLLSIYKRLGDPGKIAQAQLELARALRQQGARSNAYDMVISSIQIFKQLNDHEGRAEAELELAEIEIERRNFEKALGILTEILHYYTITDNQEKITLLHEKIRIVSEALEKQKNEVPEPPNPHLETLSRLANLTPENLETWRMLVNAYYSGNHVRGTTQRLVKGGLCVVIDGFETFLPGSHVDLVTVSNYAQFLGREMELQVVKFNDKIKNVVVSRKAVLEKEFYAQRESILEKLEKDQVIEGIVKNNTHFGTFVDLGGVDGLVYITDISWGRVNHPSEVLRLGQRIQVKVLDFTEDKKRIYLGIKQLQPEPWDSLPASIQVGSVVKGTVVNIQPYGAFLSILPGLEGLLHFSEITWSNQAIKAREYFKLGDVFTVKIISLDIEAKQMGLSVKQLTEDIWSEIENHLPVNSAHWGIVRNITPYGLFVELDKGFIGLVHKSDLSWTMSIKDAHEFTSIGEKLEVIILNIDKEKRRIGLGHKQLTENPWNKLAEIYAQGTYHQGKVISLDTKGGRIELEDQVFAFIPKKHLKKEDDTFAQEGESLIVKVIEINPNDGRLLVSHLRYLEDLNKIANIPETKKQKQKKQKPKKEKPNPPFTLADTPEMQNILEQYKPDLQKNEDLPDLPDHDQPSQHWANVDPVASKQIIGEFDKILDGIQSLSKESPDYFHDLELMVDMLDHLIKNTVKDTYSDVQPVLEHCQKLLGFATNILGIVEIRNQKSGKKKVLSVEGVLEILLIEIKAVRDLIANKY